MSGSLRVQVYEATDTKLNRQVALKILPEAFASDPDRLTRFQREAQVLASLNHPNIGAIHGIEDSEGTKALVLELVEGPTLADRIAQGPIPENEALPIAKQIAEALEAAHEEGVIHRDLKPANVKLKDDGTVKVLDFGLAKALEGDAGGDPSQSPTLTAAATQAGLIMGTAAYMTPEQAKGKVADKRADIWAFGVVLLEMLTGRRVFEGETVSETLAAVMMREPAWDQPPGGLPPTFSNLIRRCLEKDPKRRVRDIGDVRLAMTGAFDTSVAASPQGVVRPELQMWQRPVPAVLLALAVVGVTSAAWMSALFTLQQTQPPARFSITVPESERLLLSNLAPSQALSPDGRTVVYAATDADGQRLYRRPLAQLEAVSIPGTEGARFPFFSPDGEWLGFELDGTLKRMTLAGGPPATVYEGPLQAIDASWGSNDVIAFGITTDRNPIMGVPAAGGVAEPITQLLDGEADHRQPYWLPGAAALLFSVDEPGSGIDNSRVAVQSISTGERRDLLVGSSPRYVPTGHIVFAREGAVWAVPFDVDQLELMGDPVPVLEDVSIGTSGFAQFVVAKNGTLLYRRGGQAAGGELVWVDRRGLVEPIAAERRAYGGLRIAPDGQRVAAVVQDDNIDVLVYDLARDTPTRLTFHPAQDSFPVWTPDGERIVFASAREGGSCSGKTLSSTIRNSHPTADGWPTRPTSQARLKSTSGRSRIWTTADGRSPVMAAVFLSGDLMAVSCSFAVSQTQS